MPLKIKQEKFLANAKNKSSLINMLRETLAENKIFSCQAEADADRLIIETAINLQSENIVVVSEDVDVLVLLTALSPIDREIYFRKPGKGKIPQKVYSSKSLEQYYQNVNSISCSYMLSLAVTRRLLFSNVEKMCLQKISRNGWTCKTLRQFLKMNAKMPMTFLTLVLHALLLYTLPPQK